MKKAIQTVSIIALCLALSCADSFAMDGGKCKGMTKENKPCSRNAVKGTEYCYQHNPNAHHCGAIKKDGKPCQIVTKEGLCHIHKQTKN
jgi:hypothetical protein